MALMVNDVKRAYFYTPVNRPIYIELPEEDRSDEDRRLDNVGVLNYSMYGTRDAAQNWGNKVASQLTSIGFIRGLAGASMFYHPIKKVATLVHGDVYVSVGRRADLEWLKARLEDEFDIKTTYNHLSKE